MKKLFTLIAALFVAGVSFADEVELPFVEGHTVLISDIEAAGGVDTDIVRFYIVNNSDGSRDGWGIGGFANSDNWSPIVSWTGQAGSSWVQEHTVAEIKDVAGTTPGEYHDIGITINIYNDCAVEKVTLVTGGSDPVVDDPVIFDEPTVFDSWSATIVIPATKFANAQVGDIIRVYYSNKGDDFNPIYKHVSDWSDFEELQGGIVITDEYFEAPITEGAIDELKASGLRFQGLGFTIDRVELISSADGIESVKAVQVENGAIYNLAGQRVTESYKGVVIKNGHKYIQK